MCDLCKQAVHSCAGAGTAFRRGRVQVALFASPLMAQGRERGLEGRETKLPGRAASFHHLRNAVL